MKFDACMEEWLRGKDEEGIDGVIKKFWEDFHVREILPDGTICQLDELISRDEVESKWADEVERESGKLRFGSETQFSLTEEERSRLLSEGVLTTEDVDGLETFVNIVMQYDVKRLSCHTARSDEPSSQVPAPCEEDGVVENRSHVAEAETAAPAAAQTETDGETRAEPEQDADEKMDGYEVNNGMSRLEKEEQARYGLALRTLKGKLASSHVFVTGPMDRSAEELKAARTKIHSLIAEVLPFLSTDTLTLEELKRVRAEPLIQRVNIGQELLEKVKAVKIDTAKLDERVDFTTVDDSVRILRVKFKPIAVAFLLSFNLSRPRPSRNPWSNQNRWPKAQPPYLNFTLLKSNRDTADAVSKIAAAVGFKNKAFSFAGTKDKRGITVQRISAFKLPKERLMASITKREWDGCLRIGNLSYTGERVKLGNLAGNHFKIVIRDVPRSKLGAAEVTCKRFAETGFINYFGLQRFGTKRIRTHEIGAALIAGRHEQAVRMILGDEKIAEEWRAGLECDDASSLENPAKKRKTEVEEAAFNERCGCHHYIYKDDAKEALKRIASWMFIEKALLGALVKDPKGFVPALQQLAKNSLALYYHAAQSLLWNAVASERIRRHGFEKVVIGDIVCPHLEEEAAEAEDDDALAPPPEQDEEEEAAELTSPPKRTFQIIHIRDEESAQKYDISEVVLPLPGEDVEYPENLRDGYASLAKKLLGVSLEAFADNNTKRLCNLLGSYRKLIVKPRHLAFEVLQPGSFPASLPLLASDLDRLLGREIALFDTFTHHLKPIVPVVASTAAPEAAAAPPSEDGGNGGCDKDEVEEEVPDDAAGNEKEEMGAVLFSCSLPRSSYLTAALREILSARAVDALSDRPASFGGSGRAAREMHRGGGGRGRGDRGRGGRGRGRGSGRGGRRQ